MQMPKTLIVPEIDDAKSLEDLKDALKRYFRTQQRNHLYLTNDLLFMPRDVTYSTDMDTDVVGSQREIVFCTTDSIFYGCTSGGAKGSATWKALNA